MSGHAHSAAGAGRDRLAVVFVVTFVVMLVEFVGGLVSNSLALLADAGHMFTDTVGIGLALGAIWIAGRAPDRSRTFGYLRLEIMAAVVNAVLLFGVAGFVLFEAWHRLSAPPDAMGALYFLPGQFLFVRRENGREVAKALSSEQIARAFREYRTDTGWVERRILRYREQPEGNFLLSYEPAREAER